MLSIGGMNLHTRIGYDSLTKSIYEQRFNAIRTSSQAPRKKVKIGIGSKNAGGFRNCFFFEIRRNRKILDIDLFDILV